MRAYCRICWNIFLLLVIFIIFLLHACVACAETIVLPEKTVMIDEEAFLGDLKLERVILPEGITQIGARAFANSGLSEINLPASIEHIADDAFENTRLRMVYEQKETYAYTWLINNGYENVIWRGPEEIFTYRISNLRLRNITRFLLSLIAGDIFSRKEEKSSR